VSPTVHHLPSTDPTNHHQQGSPVQTLLRTTRFGDIPLDHDRTFAFPDGLLGFPHAKSFLALNVDDDPDMYWLQCADDGALAFLAISPWIYFPDYEPEIDEGEQHILELDQADDATVLCLLTIDRDADLITANLLGPIVLNIARKLGRQVVLADVRWPIAARLGNA
jgi:flagellar assembly factor FliW